ncbi:50S ribosomal protein L6 [Candidatus Woesearchaeota archaeon]|nr:50S ribosomal protein L6 [Candidatus Woesearchaeota archaeon]
MNDKVELPGGVSASVHNFIITVKGPKGEVKRKLTAPSIQVKVTGNVLELSVKKGTKREKTAINTLIAHVRNMVKGVQQPWVYKLKVCSSHFPMNVALNGKEFTIKNLFGEKVPRTIKIKDGVTVKVAGQDITVESTDLELAGNTASDIEQLARICHVDRRVFQDGIHMTEKCGVKVE